MAVLKTGAIYVPVDLCYPNERIRYILNDTQTAIILTNEEHCTRISEILADGLPMSITDNDDVQKIPSVFAIDKQKFYDQIQYEYGFINNLSSTIDYTDIAYIIYTSGTTGVPKGIIIDHGTIIDKLNYLIINHKIDSSFNILAKTPCVFDPSLREIFLSLLSGATLVIADEEVINDPTKLLLLCISAKIHLVVFVPSQLRLFICCAAIGDDFLN